MVNMFRAALNWSTLWKYMSIDLKVYIQVHLNADAGS